MAPPSDGLNFGSLGPDAQVDAIDLTLSSPEPEQRPRLASQQQRLPSYFKTEPRSTSSTSRRIKSERSASVRVPHGSQSHPRPIDPQHLANIVKSTDYQIVEALLLDLCLRSPALSGAVARGLAPHSTFAQSIIRSHQPNPRGSNSRPPTKDGRSDGQDARGRMKQRLAARIAASGSRPSQARSPTTLGSAQSARSAGSQSAPRIKHELRPDTAEPDSDLDQYIPRDFPVNSQQATRTRLPLQEVSSSETTSSTSRPFFPSQPFAHSQGRKDLETKTMRCIKCHEEIEDEDKDGLCFYHIGPVSNINGTLTCGQCHKCVKQPGCGFGTHYPTPDTDIDAFKAYSSNRS